jgi:hypothetical protein
MNAQEREYLYTDSNGNKHYKDYDRLALLTKEERVLENLDLPLETKRKTLMVCKVFKGRIILIKDRRGNIEFQNGIL